MNVKREQPKIVKDIQKLFDTDKEYNSKGLMVVQSVLDIGEYYSVFMTLKNLSKDDFMVDGYFKVDKNISKITPWNPNEDKKKYIEALKSPIYVRPF